MYKRDVMVYDKNMSNHEYPTNTEAFDMLEDLRDDMAAAGMPRTSNLNGGQVEGRTDNTRALGWYINCADGDEVSAYGFDSPAGHMIVGGVFDGITAGVTYREDVDEYGDTMEWAPVDADKVLPRIAAVVADNFGEVVEIKITGHSVAWDHDIKFAAVVR